MHSHTRTDLPAHPSRVINVRNPNRARPRLGWASYPDGQLHVLPLLVPPIPLGPFHVVHHGPQRKILHDLLPVRQELLLVGRFDHLAVDGHLELHVIGMHLRGALETTAGGAEGRVGLPVPILVVELALVHIRGREAYGTVERADSVAAGQHPSQPPPPISARRVDRRGIPRENVLRLLHIRLAVVLHGPIDRHLIRFDADPVFDPQQYQTLLHLGDVHDEPSG
mmetsp:Transcript_3475/g.9061  ORF Transcript_3475/g.9061 Transcript_3475/m.9061 type:complete len:224 (-) Transcript_3475:2700-3371(-)